MADQKSSRQDVYQLVTDIILEKLEQGVIPWKQCWSSKGSAANCMAYYNTYLLTKLLQRKQKQLNEWSQGIVIDDNQHSLQEAVATIKQVSPYETTRIDGTEEPGYLLFLILPTSTPVSVGRLFRATGHRTQANLTFMQENYFLPCSASVTT